MKLSSSEETLLIIDFGSQVTQLIARRVRELNIYSRILPYYKINEAWRTKINPKAIILSGSPFSVHDKDAPFLPTSIFDGDVPILGICYGMQMMSANLGGVVEKSASQGEFGRAMLQAVDDKHPLFNAIDFNNEEAQVWMSHGDKVTQLPPNFKIIAASQDTPIAAIAHDSQPFYGVQFHPEVMHSYCGKKILYNFVNSICGFSTTMQRVSS